MTAGTKRMRRRILVTLAGATAAALGALTTGGTAHAAGTGSYTPGACGYGYIGGGYIENQRQVFVMLPAVTGYVPSGQYVVARVDMWTVNDRQAQPATQSVYFWAWAGGDVPTLTWYDWGTIRRSDWVSYNTGAYGSGDAAHPTVEAHVALFWLDGSGIGSQGDYWATNPSTGDYDCDAGANRY